MKCWIGVGVHRNLRDLESTVPGEELDLSESGSAEDGC
jgi:hypothetical protein